MNQILDYNPNKSSKGSSGGSDKIVKFFAIMLILFALCLVAMGVYRMYDRNNNSNTAELASNSKAQIDVEEIEGNLKISVTHTKAIEKLTYSWNDNTETTVKGNGSLTLEKEIQIPTGTNILYINVTDIDGVITTFEKEYSVENGKDIINPVITLSVTQEKKLKITVTDETALDFITYRWDEEEEVRIDAKEDNPKVIEEEIEILKGNHDITVIAVDASNNTTNETKNYKGLTNPEITLTLSADKTKVTVAVKHDTGVKGITGSLNGQDFNVDGIQDGTTDLTFDLNLVQGVNQVKVIATSVEGTEKIAEQEFTYGEDTPTEEEETEQPEGTEASNKPQVSVTQDSNNNKKAIFDMKYAGGLKTAKLEFNGQSYDVNIPEGANDANFELDLAEGENSIMITVVGNDGATQIVSKTFIVQ